MEYKIDNADICELTHNLTVRDCEARSIEWNILVSDCAELGSEKNDNRLFSVTEIYTPEAQELFNEYYDIITESLGV